MLPYLKFWIVIVVLSVLVRYFQNKTPFRLFFIITIFIVMSLFGGLRNEMVGTDAPRYAAFFMSTSMIASVKDSDLETGLNVVGLVAHFFSDNYISYFTIASAITAFCLLRGVLNLAFCFPICMIALLALTPFTISFNMMRQGVAIAIVLCSLESLINKSLWRFALYIVIAALFHKSALFMLPFYFVLNGWHPKTSQTAFYILITSLLAGLLIPVLIDNAGLFSERYEHFEENEAEEVGSFSTFCMCLLLPVFFLGKNLITNNKQKYMTFFHMYIIACMIAAVCVYLGHAGSGGRRLCMYFSLGVIPMWAMIYESIKDKTNRLVFVAGFAGMSLVYYYFVTKAFGDLSPYTLNPIIHEWFR